MSSSTPPPKKKARHGDAKSPSTTVTTGDASSEGISTEDVERATGFTVELWVEIVDFLDFQELMLICEVSRMFLKEVIPRIEAVAIDASALLPAIVKRLSCVKIIHIDDVFEIGADTYWDLEFNKMAMMMMPHFLSHFPYLEFVCLRGWKQDSTIPDEWKTVNLFQYPELTVEDSRTIQAFVATVCRMIASRSVPANVEIVGMLSRPICTDREKEKHNNDCKHCKALCHFYNIVLLIECLAGIGTSEITENVICLLPRTALERMKERVGGSDAVAAMISTDVLLAAIENEKLDFVQALVDMRMLPQVKRSDIDSFEFGSFGFESVGKSDERKPAKPRIFRDLFDLLVLKGIPLKKSDFGVIFTDKTEFDNRDPSYHENMGLE